MLKRLVRVVWLGLSVLSMCLITGRSLVHGVVRLSVSVACRRVADCRLFCGATRRRSFVMSMSG